MRWYLAGVVMLAACGFSGDDAMRVSTLLHERLGCPTPLAGLVGCPDGGKLERRGGSLTISGCTEGELVLDGADIAVNVQCTSSAGVLDIVGAFTTGDGEECGLDLHVGSTISQSCNGLFGATPCETDWSTTGTICGYSVDETCTGNDGFLSFVDCR
jgi:hypothetical protein